jgi:hypothetical protein
MQPKLSYGLGFAQKLKLSLHAAKPRRAAYGLEEVTRMVQSHFPSDIFIDFLNWQEYMLLPRILCC